LRQLDGTLPTAATGTSVAVRRVSESFTEGALEMLDAQRRAAITQRWFEAVIAAYPGEAVRFFGTQSDRFANPVGTTLRRSLTELLDGLVEGREPDQLHDAIDGVVRIRAVQDFTPSEALSFVPALKPILGEALRSDPQAYRDMEVRLDRLLMAAVDHYVACREQVWEIRITEIRNRSIKVLERFNQWRDRRDGDGDDVAAP
jgi:hypothetical protein